MGCTTEYIMPCIYIYVSSWSFAFTSCTCETCHTIIYQSQCCCKPDCGTYLCLNNVKNYFRFKCHGKFRRLMKYAQTCMPKMNIRLFIKIALVGVFRNARVLSDQRRFRWCAWRTGNRWGWPVFSERQSLTSSSAACSRHPLRSKWEKRV